MHAPSDPSSVRHVCLNGISWGLYQRLVHEVVDGHARLTYDNGRLEIMAPSGFHEDVKQVIADIIATYCSVMRIKYKGLGSTTFDRESLAKGVEPDVCYYFAKAPSIIGKREFNWEVDPAPDLVIEIDISHASVAREPIYAALGVPEIWRYDGEQIAPLQRVEDSAGARYIPIDKSLSLPALPIKLLNRLLIVGERLGNLAATDELRHWLEQQKA